MRDGGTLKTRRTGRAGKTENKREKEPVGSGSSRVGRTASSTPCGDVAAHWPTMVHVAASPSKYPTECHQQPTPTHLPCSLNPPPSRVTPSRPWLTAGGRRRSPRSSSRTACPRYTRFLCLSRDLVDTNYRTNNILFLTNTNTTLPPPPLPPR